MKLKFLVAALLGIMCHQAIAGITIGEMVVKIQDATTGKPMSGVYVYRNMLTQYIYYLFEARTVDQSPDYAVTNSEGIAIFPKKTLPRKRISERISFIGLSVNSDCDKSYDQNNALAHAEALGGSEQNGGDIFSKNRTNDALILSLAYGDLYAKGQYEVTKTAKPRREYIRYLLQYDFKEPYKTIVIKLGNASVVENGVKTEVTLEDAASPQQNSRRGQAFLLR